jgi:hypothetical protein
MPVIMNTGPLCGRHCAGSQGWSMSGKWLTRLLKSLIITSEK